MIEKTHQIGVRVKQNEHVLLRRVTESRGEDVSDFVRRAIRKELASLGFLKAADLQALGVARRTKATQR